MVMFRQGESVGFFENVKSVVFSAAGGFGGALFRKTDVAPLAVFRILFGFLMCLEVLRYYFHDRIDRYYVEPSFFFPFVDWVRPLGEWMYVVFILMGVSALLLALGWHYRIASVSFFVLYTYVFLIDKAQYNNHYYFICLLAFLFIVTDANRAFSVDSWRRNLSPMVPSWQIFIFRIQVFVVFFFAGLAKLNADWLAGEPARAWLANRVDYPLIGRFLVEEWFVYSYVWGGLLFDLLIGFLLLHPRTVYFGLPFLLGFNVMNKWFYSIGIFPYLATAVFVLFMSAYSMRRLLGVKRRSSSSYVKERERSVLKRTGIAFFIVLFLVLQLLIPLRHFAIPGNVSWTDEGHNFSWHMKLRDKDSYELLFYTKDSVTGRVEELSMWDLTNRQQGKMSTRPDMILQYAHHLRDRLVRRGVEDPSVYVRVFSILNSRHQGWLIDETVNLAKEEYKWFSRNDWITLAPEPIQ